MTERSPTERSPTERSPTERSWPLTTLPWQSESWARLQRALAGDRLAHALLLCGDAGIGKTRFSRALTALLLCHQADTAGACGHCHSCRLLQAGSHSDLLDMAPEPDSRVIKIDQVRSLLDFANQTSALGPRKVVLINPAEVLNLNAANALLKCLEEPTAGTYMLLVSHASNRLSATIRSRCQLLSMPVPALEQSRSWLARMTGDSKTSNALLEITGNRPTLALDLHHSGGLQQQQTLQQSLDELISGAISALEFFKLVAKLELSEILGLFARRLQTAIKIAVLHRPGDLRRHFLLLDELLRLQRVVTHGGNPNRQLTIENCAAQLARVLGAGR